MKAHKLVFAIPDCLQAMAHLKNLHSEKGKLFLKRFDPDNNLAEPIRRNFMILYSLYNHLISSHGKNKQYDNRREKLLSNLKWILTDLHYAFCIAKQEYKTTADVLACAKAVNNMLEEKVDVKQLRKVNEKVAVAVEEKNFRAGDEANGLEALFLKLISIPAQQPQKIMTVAPAKLLRMILKAPKWGFELDKSDHDAIVANLVKQSTLVISKGHWRNYIGKLLIKNPDKLMQQLLDSDFLKIISPILDKKLREDPKAMRWLIDSLIEVRAVLKSKSKPKFCDTRDVMLAAFRKLCCVIDPNCSAILQPLFKIVLPSVEKAVGIAHQDKLARKYKAYLEHEPTKINLSTVPSFFSHLVNPQTAVNQKATFSQFTNN